MYYSVVNVSTGLFLIFFLSGCKCKEFFCLFKHFSNFFDNICSKMLSGGVGRRMFALPDSEKTNGRHRAWADGGRLLFVW